MAKRMNEEDDDISVTPTDDERWLEDQEFEVETILAEDATEDGETIYLIQWKGYHELDSTWEPPENIQDDSIIADWRVRRMKEMRKTIKPFDLADFQRRKEQREAEKADRHRRRKAKRKQMGLPVSPSPVSEAEESDSSSEAVESDEQPEDSRGMQKLPSKQRVQRSGIFQTKISAKENATELDDSHEVVYSNRRHQRSPRITKLSSQARQISQSPSDSSWSKDVPIAELRNRQQSQKSSEEAVSQQKQRGLATETPSSTGYQGTARARPPGPRTAFKASRNIDEGPKATSSSAIANRGNTVSRGVSRGRGAIRGGSSSSRNVFAPRSNTQPRKKKTFVDQIVAPNPSKPPGHFKTMSTRRKAELAGRAVADAAPDVSALPGGLIDPSKGFMALRPTDVRKEQPVKAKPQEDESFRRPPSPVEVPREDLTVESQQFHQPLDPAFSDPSNMVCWYWYNKGNCFRANDPQKPCKYLHYSPENVPIRVAPRPPTHEEKPQVDCRYGPGCWARRQGSCPYRHPERETSEDSTTKTSIGRPLPTNDREGQILKTIQRMGSGQELEDSVDMYPPWPQACVAFTQGQGCMAGNTCRDAHPDKSQTARGNQICRYWVDGMCKFPEAGCPYRHGFLSDSDPHPKETQEQTSRPITNGAYHKSVAFAFDEPMELCDEPEAIPSLTSSMRPDSLDRQGLEGRVSSSRPPLQSHHSTTSILDQHQVQVAAERRPSLPSFMPPPITTMKKTTKVTFGDYQLNNEYKETRGMEKKVIFGSELSQSIMVKFVNLEPVAKDADIYQSLDTAQTFKFEQTCSAQDFQFYQETLLGQVHCQGHICSNSVGHRIIEASTEYLNGTSGGLVCPCRDFVILLYPTKCEQWRFVSSSNQGQSRLSYLIFKPDGSVKVPREKPFDKITIPKSSIKCGATYSTLLANKIHSLSYSTLLPVPDPTKLKEPLFYLMFPLAARLDAEFIASFIKAKNSGARMFSSETEGSWNYFVGAKASAKIVLFHESSIYSVLMCPSILKLLSSREPPIYFWCIDDAVASQPQFVHLPPVTESKIGHVRATQFFPGVPGGAILLTPSFLVTEPEKTLEFLLWFETAVRKAPFGTWKLICCFNIRQYLLNLAIDKASELKQFKEDHRDDDAMDANALKKGLSYEKCKKRFDIQNKMVDLLSRGIYFTQPSVPVEAYSPNINGHQTADDDGRTLQDNSAAWSGMCEVDEPNEDFSHIVFADRLIDPDDEQGLATWFAAWSLRRLDVFRRFFIVGTGKDHKDRAFRLKIFTPRMVKNKNDHGISDKPSQQKQPISFKIHKHDSKTALHFTNKAHELNLDGVYDVTDSDTPAIEIKNKALTVAERLSALPESQAFKQVLQEPPNITELQEEFIRRNDREPRALGDIWQPNNPTHWSNKWHPRREFQDSPKPITSSAVATSDRLSTHSHPYRDGDRDLPTQSSAFAQVIPSGTVLIALQYEPRKPPQVELHSGDLVKVIKHVSGVFYHGKNLTTNETGQFRSIVLTKDLPRGDKVSRKWQLRPSQQISPLRVGIILVAEESNPKVGDQLDVRVGELVEITKHIGGIIHYGKNLNSGESGHFPNTIFPTYLSQGKRLVAKTSKLRTASLSKEEASRQLCTFFNERGCKFPCLRKHLCCICGLDHSANVCPEKSLHSLQTHIGTKIVVPLEVLRSQVCGWFNDGCCKLGSHCPRKHVCATCQEKSHGAEQCPGYKDTTMDNPTKTNYHPNAPQSPSPIQGYQTEEPYSPQYDRIDKESDFGNSQSGDDSHDYDISEVRGPCSVQRIPSGYQYLLQYDGIAEGPFAERQPMDGTTNGKTQQTSIAGIETSATGQRFVPRSIRPSGTTRPEIRIRPGYVPPEDNTSVYRSPRAKKVNYESNQSSGPANTADVSTASAASPATPQGLSPVALADYIATTPTPEPMLLDETSNAEVFLSGGDKKRRKIASPDESEFKRVLLQIEVTSEWYGRLKASGNAWEHILVGGWEDVFKAIDPQLAIIASKSS